jgi:16S rRNA (uracil1498-N3)-methyltransferase
MRRRFFVPQFDGDTAVIEGDTAHHLGRVLRAQQGQLYELSDGVRVRLGRIEKVARDRVDFTLLEDIAAHSSPIDVTLLLSVVKFDHFEWAIEKATELGVNTIVPLAAARSEKGLVAGAEKRADRWRKVLIESSQQSRRLRVPLLQPISPPTQAFSAHTAATKVMLSERPDAPALLTSFPQRRPPASVKPLSAT